MDIVLTVADCASILKSSRNTVVKIAELLFYGIIRLIGYLGSKLISWIISKVCSALWWAKFIIEQILYILWDWLLSSKFVDKIRSKYVNYVDANKMNFAGYLSAMLKGAKACFA